MINTACAFAYLFFTSMLFNICFDHMDLQSPESLVKQGGYDHLVALFGPPTFSVNATLYYADSELCDSDVDTSKGYPIREMDDDVRDMPAWSSPFILMVDRGQCTLSQKLEMHKMLGRWLTSSPIIPASVMQGIRAYQRQI